jgi:hypothetical protein
VFERFTGRGTGPFHAGDTHELTIDVATGMTLAVTSVVDGTFAVVYARRLAGELLDRAFSLEPVRP